ncbi:acetamidase/formamidase family protein [Candidatus Bathyarchaeota archaeon]|nr:acetamidase/formamidase family protein [Candidatus Bathyarchaeota archaeon]
MTVHNFEPMKYYKTFGSYEPVLRIKDGDTVVTKTVDNAGRDFKDDQVASGPNPLTGPFYVEGAEPGDVLAVQLDRLWPNRQIGRSSTVIAPHVLEPRYVSEFMNIEPSITAEWKLDLEKGTATLLNPKTKMGQIVLPLHPLLGCIGVAPEDGQSISSITSGQYGGNMDYNGFVSGVTMYFPVFMPGALFFVGDGHAVQADGEIAGTGIEVSFDVKFTVSLIKNKNINWPRAENREYLMTVGNACPLDQALQIATTEMVRWLKEDYDLTDRSLHILLGQCVEYDVGNVFDPAYTVACKIKKKWLQK